jgi:hypothetical protein
MGCGNRSGRVFASPTRFVLDFGDFNYYEVMSNILTNDISRARDLAIIVGPRSQATRPDNMMDYVVLAHKILVLRQRRRYREDKEKSRMFREKMVG